MNTVMHHQTGQQPRYEGQGWTQWPDHPELSFQLLRVLGASQEGASTVSECFLAASRMEPGNLEHWYTEWQKLGDVNARRASAALQAGHVHTAKSNLLRAANYYRSSEFYLDPDDPRRLETFRKVADASQTYLGLLAPAGEIVSIDVGDGSSLDAYFIKPSDAATRWPAVICFGGLDEYKDELLHEIPKFALPRGMAVLLVDLPGQGGTLRLRGTPNRPDCEVPVGRCIDYLETRTDVDGARIAVYGASLGGIYSARAASAERRVRAVVSDSLVFDLHASIAARMREPDQLMWKHLKWVFGRPTMQGVADKSAQFKMEGFLAGIRCPYLIVQGEHDFLGLQTALDAYEFAKAKGVNVELKLFSADETGASHCQVDNATLGQEFICDWIADQLGLRQAPDVGRRGNVSMG